MVYAHFGTCLTLVMVYVPIKMHLALYVPIRISAMVYILVKMCLALAMAYAPFEMHMALVMMYIPIKTCLNPYGYGLHSCQNAPSQHYLP
jgi:hypothetical protein